MKSIPFILSTFIAVLGYINVQAQLSEIRYELEKETFLVGETIKARFINNSFQKINLVTTGCSANFEKYNGVEWKKLWKKGVGCSAVMRHHPFNKKVQDIEISPKRISNYTDTPVGKYRLVRTIYFPDNPSQNYQTIISPHFTIVNRGIWRN